MNTFSLTVKSILVGQNLLHNQTISIVDGKITGIENAPKQKQNILSGTLVAGFIDLQVNGGGGVLFNHSPDIESLMLIGQAHQQFGTTAWLPTLVTDSIEQMQRAADAVAEAIKQKVPGILGIHFEGPLLSVSKKGVHDERFIRSISSAEQALFTRNDIGKVLVTLAPESVTNDDIQSLAEKGVFISLGHSNATFEQTRAAISAGATGFTHLYNAMSAMQTREPGMVGTALLAEGCYSGLILDAVHVHPESARIAMNSTTNIMLVTDAMPPVGSQQNEFEFFGQTIKREGNMLRDEQGRLAGSVLDMATAVKNCTSLLGLSLAEASEMASLNPAKFLQLDEHMGDIAIGKKANFVLLNEQLEVVSNWIDGQVVYESTS